MSRHLFLCAALAIGFLGSAEAGIRFQARTSAQVRVRAERRYKLSSNRLSSISPSDDPYVEVTTLVDAHQPQHRWVMVDSSKSGYLSLPLEGGRSLHTPYDPGRARIFKFSSKRQSLALTLGLVEQVAFEGMVAQRGVELELHAQMRPVVSGDFLVTARATLERLIDGVWAPGLEYLLEPLSGPMDAGGLPAALSVLAHARALEPAESVYLRDAIRKSGTLIGDGALTWGDSDFAELVLDPTERTAIVRLPLDEPRSAEFGNRLLTFEAEPSQVD